MAGFMRYWVSKRWLRTPPCTSRSKRDRARPSAAAMSEETVGGSWQWSPSSTTCSAPWQKGTMVAISVACEASSIRTRPNAYLSMMPLPAPMAVVHTTLARLIASWTTSWARRLSVQSLSLSMPKALHAISSAQCLSSSGRAVSGRPRRITSTPRLPTPSTILSTAMLESEAAMTCPPFGPPPVRAHCCRIFTASDVLPVPGGPWIRTMDCEMAASSARRWLAFKRAWSTWADRIMAQRDSAALHAPGPVVSTASMIDLDGLIFTFRVLSPFPPLPSGAARRCSEAMIREYCCRFASLSMRNLPSSLVTGTGGGPFTNLITRGRSFSTSASSRRGCQFQFPSAWTPTESPFTMPRRSSSMAAPPKPSTTNSPDFMPSLKRTPIFERPAWTRRSGGSVRILSSVWLASSRKSRTACRVLDAKYMQCASLSHPAMRVATSAKSAPSRGWASTGIDSSTSRSAVCDSCEGAAAA
mmetsp:Transcript_2931/g.8770  ORF Transcript_2931/g.8770 Transcript_2931/m.8770 type:complete len:471 (-) Transcript_2931:390-1802(-)